MKVELNYKIPRKPDINFQDMSESLGSIGAVTGRALSLHEILFA